MSDYTYLTEQPPLNPSSPHLPSGLPGFVAGGAALWRAKLALDIKQTWPRRPNDIEVFWPMWRPNDIDVFFETVNDFYFMKHLMSVRDNPKLNESPFSVSYSVPVSLVLNYYNLYDDNFAERFHAFLPDDGANFRLQLIKPEIACGSPEEVLSRFDFTICRVAIVNESVFAHNSWRKDVENSLLKIRTGHLPIPEATVARVLKYHKRGFVMSPADFISLIGKVKDLSIIRNFIREYVHVHENNSLPFLDVLEEAYKNIKPDMDLK